MIGVPFQKGYTPWNKGRKGVMKAWNKGLTGYKSGEQHYNFGKKRPGVGGAPKGHIAWNKGLSYKMSEEHKKKISQALIGHRNCNSRKRTKYISYLPSNPNGLIYKEKGLVN